MENIYDPITGNQYSIFSVEGKRVLKQYIKQFQTGGMVIKLNKDMFSPKNANDFGHDTCVINTLNWIGMPKNLVLELIKAYKYEHRTNPDAFGIHDEVYLRVLNKWVGELVNPENPEHKRLVLNQEIKPFKFVPITVAEKLTTYEYFPTLVNKIFSYIKPMTARILNIDWNDGTGHLTCAVRDGNNIPFMVELQNIYGEDREEDCQHVPYDWPDVIEYFENANKVQILMGGPTLKPVKDSHNFVRVDDLQDKDSHEEGGGGAKSDPASKGSLSHPPGIEQRALTRTLSNKRRLVNRGDIMMEYIKTSPQQQYGKDTYDDEILEKYRRLKDEYPDIYQLSIDTESYIGDDGFFDLIEHGFTSKDDFFKPERVQDLRNFNYDNLSILRLQYHADQNKLKEYYSEMYELTKDHEPLVDGVQGDKYFMVALELGYTTPEKLLNAIKNDELTPSDALNEDEINVYIKMFPEIDEMIKQNQKLYDFIGSNGFVDFNILVKSGFDTPEKLLEGLRDGGVDEHFDEIQKQKYKNMFKDKIIEQIHNLPSFPLLVEDETKLMRFMRYENYAYPNDYDGEIHYDNFDEVFGEDSIYDVNFFDNLVKENEDVLRKLRKHR